MEILLGLSLFVVGCLVTLIVPILGLVRAAQAMSEVRQLRVRIGALEHELTKLTKAQAATAAAAGPAASPATPSPPAPETSAATPPVSEVSPEVVQAGEVPTDTTVPAVAEPVIAALPQPEAPPPSIESVPVPAAASESRHREGVEAAIGGRLLLYAGALTVVLGVAFFLKYAFDRNWITEWMRVAIGVLSGVGLVALGLRLARRGYRGYGQILSGIGLAVLYLSVYAAFSFYDLIGRTTAFALFVGVTAAAAWLSDRQQSQGMAVMAVGGGFLTPFLVGGDSDAQVTLFSYVALLIAGTMWLARRRGWPLLVVMAYAFTVITVGAWAADYYTPSKYLRTTLLLTVFCGLFIVARWDAASSQARGARFANVILATAPVLYHIVTVVVLFNHGVALLVYLLAMSVAGVAWAMHIERAGLRLLLWAAALLPLIGWVSDHQSHTWLLPGLVTIGGIFLIHLVAQFDRLIRHNTKLGWPDLVLAHGNGLGAFLAVYVLLERTSLAWVPYAGLVLAALHAVVGRQIRLRDLPASLHALAVSFSLLAAVVAVQLDGGWLTAAWSAEGAAVVLIAVWMGQSWFRAAGGALFAVSIWRWMAFTLPSDPAVFDPFRNETLLLGLWLTILLYVMAWAHYKAPRSLAYRSKSLAALLVAASTITTITLTAESESYWQQRGDMSPDATFARGLTLSVFWAAYAGLLIVLGIRKRYAPIRYFAIGLLALTIGKVFLSDLSELEGIYRVLGLLIVGAILLVVSFLYQRVTRSPGAPPEPVPPAVE
jgi:uncharacterized membrane protein